MRRPDNSLPADITLCVGATGSGKSSWIRQRIRKEKRVLVWDSKDEYCDIEGFRRVTSPSALAQALRSGNGRIAFAAGPDLFPFWCRAAFAWGHCVAIAEELADVVPTSKAPQAWGELLRKGRAYGVRPMVTTQRPQEIDKTTLGNATAVWCGVLAFTPDREYMARRLGLPGDELAKLNPLDYVYRQLPLGGVQRGSLRKKRRSRASKSR